MSEGYQPPSQKHIDQALPELIAAILKQIPKERWRFQKEVEAVILGRINDDVWVTIMNIATSFVKGFEKPDLFMPDNTKEEETDISVERRRGRPRKIRPEDLPENVIQFRSRKTV